jgi:phosphoglycolate phosphatase
MLRLISGREHQVYTGVTVIFVTGRIRKEITFSEKTEVFVRTLTENDIRNYVDTKEPMDKAGGYGIQGKFAKHIYKINGDYNNVVGLPIARLYNEVREKLGIDMVTGKRIPISEVKAAIFDLDGTTLDTIESIGTTLNKVLEENEMKQHTMEDYKIFVGDGQIELVERALKASGDEKLENFDKVMSEYIEAFKTGCRYNVKPYDGIRELLDNLKKRNIKIAIFSNKQHNNVESIIEDIFGQEYYDAVLGQREDHDKKPCGKGIDIILEQLNVAPENCIYIGDTATDMKTGKNYGLYTIGVTWGFRDIRELVEAKADNIVNKPKQILEIIDSKWI